MEEMCVASYIRKRTCAKKKRLFRQRQLDKSGVGGLTVFRSVYPARAYTTLVVLVIQVISLIEVIIRTYLTLMDVTMSPCHLNICFAWPTVVRKMSM